MNENEITIIVEQIRCILLGRPIPDDLHTHSAELSDLEDAVTYLSVSMAEVNTFLKAVAGGAIEAEAPGRDNIMAGPLKELQANLKHLTWQANQVANGDYSQHVSFLGTFSESFNRMISQLSEREAQLRQQSLMLKESMELMKSIMDGMNDWIVVMEKGTGRIIYENEAAKLDFYEEQTGQSFCGGPCGLLEQLRQETREQSVMEFKCQVKHKTLRVRSFLVQWNENLAYAHHITDVTNEKAYQEQIETMAFKDELTGIYNRRYTMSRLEELLENRQRFVFCMLDLDNLKAVNDTLGHNEGDAYIKSVIKELQAVIGAEDMIGRIGGDEFSVILPNCSEELALEKMELLNQRLKRAEKLYPLSVSYGAAFVECGSKPSAESVMSCADEKMYLSKKAKRG